MRYFKLAYYTTGGDYEWRERYIDEPTFRKYQQAIAEGSDFLILEDMVIKRTSIKEIIPADKDIQEYKNMGVSLPELGLKEPLKIESAEKKSLPESKLEEMKKKFGEKTKI